MDTINSGYNNHVMTIVSFFKNIFEKKLLYFFCLYFLTLFYVPLTEAKEKSSASQLDQVTLQLKWIHEFNFAGYYAAVEKGFYDEAGLDVKIKEGQPGMDFIDEVISGRAQYGVEMPELLIARNNGKPVVVLAAIFQHSPQIFLARADSGIKSPHNLIGKKVMWRFDSAAELRAMLVNENVSLDKVEFMELSWNINELIDGKVDAIHAYITDQPLSLEKAGVKSTILSPINYGIDFYGDCLFTSDSEISEHPERVKSFREASLRGWKYAMDNPEEIMDVIARKYKTKSTREYLQNEYEHISQLMLPNLVEIGHMNPGRWKHIGATFVKLGMLDPMYSIDGFLYDPDPQPDYTKIKKVVWILSTIISLISLCIFFLVIYNRRLNIAVRERTKHLSSEIAERKRMEEEITRHKAEFEAMFTAITDAIVFVDQYRRIIMVNPAFTKMLGYQQEELVEKTTKLIYANPEHYNKQGQIRFRPKAKIDNPVFENEYRRKDGTIFKGETLGVHVKDQNGNVIGFLGVIRDITDRKKAEENLIKFKKLDSVGVLAGGIAHDFNNILAAILGNINLALFDQSLDSSTRDLLSEAEKASLRAKKLTQQLLTFAKGGEPVKETASLESVIKESANFVLRGDKVACKFSFPDDLWLVDVDKGQLSQVIQNIVINASHAMPEGGEIVITCENVSTVDKKIISNQEDKKLVKISIKDTGIGIPEKLINKVFDPYFSTKREGSGLGLAICQSIINKHNGDIVVKSSSGAGTTFIIYLPASDKPFSPSSRIQSNDININRQAKILLMDDDEMVQNVAKAMLTKLGNTVVLAADGVEAVKCYQEAMNSDNPIQLVIMDLTIPGGMGGKEAVQNIHKLNPEAKVIVSSGYSNDPVMANFKKHGFCATIAKPFQLQDLSRVLSQVLG
ncbi:MAG: ABC transporter substrate-binding protein [Proteobacteria bacterium]|nr:ABC transporter substrate-binding protein [Pseudomonadota bacterium]